MSGYKLSQHWFRFELIPPKQFVRAVRINSIIQKSAKRKETYLNYQFKPGISLNQASAYLPVNLIKLARSLPGSMPSPEYKAFDSDFDECYIKIPLQDDIIRLQINYGQKRIMKKTCPEIAIDTLNRYPIKTTLLKVRQILKILTSNLPFQVVYYGKVYSPNAFIKLFHLGRSYDND